MPGSVSSRRSFLQPQPQPCPAQPPRSPRWVGRPGTANWKHPVPGPVRRCAANPGLRRASVRTPRSRPVRMPWHRGAWSRFRAVCCGWPRAAASCASLPSEFPRPAGRAHKPGTRRPRPPDPRRRQRRVGWASTPWTNRCRRRHWYRCAGRRWRRRTNRAAGGFPGKSCRPGSTSCAAGPDRNQSPARGPGSRQWTRERLDFPAGLRPGWYWPQPQERARPSWPRRQRRARVLPWLRWLQRSRATRRQSRLERPRTPHPDWARPPRKRGWRGRLPPRRGRPVRERKLLRWMRGL